MARILLLEDDPFLGRGLVIQLKTAGHEVVWEDTLAKARVSEGNGSFELYILDVNLPDGSGLDFCHASRNLGVRVPIIVLTARTDEDSLVAGFECGANDYVKKPFSNRELLTRIQALLRAPFKHEDDVRVGPVIIQLSQRKVLIDGRDLELNRREFDVFLCLAKNAGGVLSREQLIAALRLGENILDRTIDSHFSHIRTKMTNKGIHSVVIRSVYGVGYTLEVA